MRMWPRRSKSLWLGAAASVLCAGAVLWPQAQAKVSAVRTVAQVDLNRYGGTWYEIAHFPMFFQRNCDRDTQATYSLKSSGRVKVDNQCTRADGQVQRSVGEAWPVDSSNARLKVSFLPKALNWLPVGQGDYWILRLDPDYQVVLVGSPNRGYLWILARQPQISEATYQAYVDAARAQGFEVSKLQRTRQTGAANAAKPILH